MKIEKLNDRQIRATLTKEDLAKRHLKLSELAYGSEKTQELFQDLMLQAAIDFGFEADNIPLMVEAIPLSPEKIVMIITKVENPEELDTRFSTFTHWEDTKEEEEAPACGLTMTDEIGGDLAQLLEELRKQHELSGGTEEAGRDASGQEEPLPAPVCLYVFRDLNAAIDCAAVLAGVYTGYNDLYKDTGRGEFKLIVHQGRHSNTEFNRVMHILSSHMEQKRYLSSIEAYCEEHCRLICRGNALQTLAQIS